MLQHLFAWVATAILSLKPSNDGISLAIAPRCGTYLGAPADVSGGLAALSAYTTIVAMGDGLSDVGVHDGSKPSVPVVVPPNPKAGGRVTNGLTWVEHVASEVGAELKGYAMAGTSVIPGTPGATTNLLAQTNLFAKQGLELPPATTLYTITAGQIDVAYRNDSAHGQLAAATLAYDIVGLSLSPAVRGTNFLVVDTSGFGPASPGSAAFRTRLFEDLFVLYDSYNLNVGYVDLARLYTAVQGNSPGHRAFGYTSPESCLESNATVQSWCSDPAHTFMWMPGQPSKQTHRIIADYVQQVVSTCRSVVYQRRIRTPS